MTIAYGRVEQEVFAAVTRAAAQGLRFGRHAVGVFPDLHSRSYGMDRAYNRVCAIGAVLLGQRPLSGYSHWTDAARVLGLTVYEVREIAAGWDGDRHMTITPLVEIGARAWNLAKALSPSQ